MDEKECLIKLVKSEINGTPFEEELKDVIPQLSTNLYTFAKTHDLAHLVGDVLDKNGLLEHDANVKRKFLQERNIAIYR